eukprot:15334402-Ditylum_brightwellii.AAC.1
MELSTRQILQCEGWLSWGTESEPVIGTASTKPQIVTPSDLVYDTFVPGGNAQEQGLTIWKTKMSIFLKAILMLTFTRVCYNNIFLLAKIFLEISCYQSQIK